MTITPSVRDNHSVKQVRAVITAGSKKITLTASRSPWTMRWKPGTRTSTYPLTLTATDAAGNVRTINTKIKVNN
ncbi:Ig-like domain-containing protein [Actinoplanes sp. NPDC023801]|uniref:Ig-like domain-containing protein n=1 Tax=Actinoplanes sp. NPDC023801 TaxID=3154595 RepID=UPI0033C29469